MSANGIINQTNTTGTADLEQPSTVAVHLKAVSAVENFITDLMAEIRSIEESESEPSEQLVEQKLTLKAKLIVFKFKHIGHLEDLVSALKRDKRPITGESLQEQLQLQSDLIDNLEELLAAYEEALEVVNNQLIVRSTSMEFVEQKALLEYKLCNTQVDLIKEYRELLSVNKDVKEVINARLTEQSNASEFEELKKIAVANEATAAALQTSLMFSLNQHAKTLKIKIKSIDAQLKLTPTQVLTTLREVTDNELLEIRREIGTFEEDRREADNKDRNGRYRYSVSELTKTHILFAKELGRRRKAQEPKPIPGPLDSAWLNQGPLPAGTDIQVTRPACARKLSF